MGSTCCSTDKTAEGTQVSADTQTANFKAQGTHRAFFKGTYGTMYYVKDMKRSIEFFKNQVGLAPEYESLEWTQFNLGGHALCLHPAGDTKVTTGVGAGGALILEVTDIQKAVGSLKENRVSFIKEIQDIGCGFCADFKDLDGNVIGLYQHKPEGDMKSQGKEGCCA